MLLVAVWIAVAVVVLVVLGSVVYSVLGAMQRLRTEVVALDRDLRPVLAQVQDAAARAAESREARQAGPREARQAGDRSQA